MRILKNNPQGTPQICLFDLINIDAIIADLTILDIIEPVDQIRNGCLSGSGRSDECDLLSRLSI